MTIEIRTVDLTRDPATRSRAAVRSAIPDPEVFALAASIVAEVAAGGDGALSRLSSLHGGGLADGSHLVPSEDIEKAPGTIAPALLSALEEAITHVTAVHRPQRPTDAVVTPLDGVTVERIWSPLSSVGVYVPGGRGLYPSSLIMGVVPARIAGVERIVVATPAGPDGSIDPIVLAAACLLDVDTVHAMGGAQAVAALAHGTETIERVDKIVGPGGPWVTAAKLAVFGSCGIDLPAGPSEAAVVVHGAADPALVAADVMCQAEHGAESAVTLIVTDPSMASDVLAEIDSALPRLERRELIAAALGNHGLVAIARDLAQALEFANEWAPEHLSIHAPDARGAADSVPNAGSVFIGTWTPEAAGDYATGANHVLPTGGLARSYGPLGVEDFGSWRQVQTLTRDGLTALAPTILAMARAEGFTAHANSVTARLERTP